MSDPSVGDGSPRIVHAAARLRVACNPKRARPTAESVAEAADALVAAADSTAASGEVLAAAATSLAAAGQLDEAERLAREASVRGDSSALIDVALRHFLARHSARAREAWTLAAEMTPLPSLHSVTMEGQPWLCQCETEIVGAWLQSSSRDAAARMVGIPVSTARIHLQRVRTKYEAAGRPARTKAALTVRALEDGIVPSGQL
jgi:hypothetical protein